MRYINISNLDLSELQKKVNSKINSKPDSAWTCIKGDLGNLSCNLCWYCENNPKPTGYPEIDHWRPKGRYGWLKYIVDNFIYCCKACNSTKNEYFPLKNERNRASKQADIYLEDPLFLDPRIREDIKSITYDKSGRLIAKTAIAMDKVKITVEYLGLNRDDRIIRKNLCILSLDADLEYIFKLEIDKTPEKLKDYIENKINKKLKYDNKNECVWCLCMYIQVWFIENAEKAEIIKPYIEFPEDFVEVYLTN